MFCCYGCLFFRGLAEQGNMPSQGRSGQLVEDPRRHAAARGIQRSLVCKSLALDLPPDAMYSKPSIFWPWMCDSHLAPGRFLFFNCKMKN